MCECLTALTERLKIDGLELKDTSLAFPKDGSSPRFIPVFPLVQISNGRKPKSGQPNVIAPNYCPFCGQKY